jgi:Domain of unknown function (DUF4145)
VASKSIGPMVREGEHLPPDWRKQAFHCSWCNVLTSQSWTQLLTKAGKTPVWCVVCANCRKQSYWLVPGDTPPFCMHPQISSAPRPHASMPADVRADYEEARGIVARSPRGACGLLRLATQKVADILEPGSEDLNTKIGTLVRNGLPVQVQEALDSLRVIGNEAVHPGEMDLRDDVETASDLFDVLNFIVENQIDQPRRRAELFAKLPTAKRDGITRRDAPTS